MIDKNDLPTGPQWSERKGPHRADGGNGLPESWNEYHQPVNPQFVPRILPGDKVRYTGEYLKNTGQVAGAAGRRRWVVLECHCEPCIEGTHAHLCGRGHVAAMNLAISGVARVAEMARKGTL